MYICYATQLRQYASQRNISCSLIFPMLAPSGTDRLPAVCGLQYLCLYVVPTLSLGRGLASGCVIRKSPQLDNPNILANVWLE